MKADFSDRNDAQLIALYGEVMAELLAREIVHSGNNPIADMAERVIATYFGVDPAPANQKSYDVVTVDGKKLQVKALRQTKSSRRNLSALRDLDFDQLVAVIFAADMQLVEAVFVPVDAVRDHMGLMPGAAYNRLAEIAAERYGYVTTADAEASGLDPHRLFEMARRGQLEHPMTAVYRVPLNPATPLDPYMLGDSVAQKCRRSHLSRIGPRPLRARRR